MDIDLEKEIINISEDCIDEISYIGNNEQILDAIRKVKKNADSVSGTKEKMFLFKTILLKLEQLFHEPNGMQKNVLNSVTEMMHNYFPNNGYRSFFEFQRN